MTKIIPFVKLNILLFLIFFSSQLFSQFKKNEKLSNPKHHICTMPFIEGVHPHYVPRKVIRRSNKRNTSLNFIYNGSIPTAARNAIENGVEPIIIDLFPSDIPINIEINFDDLPEGSLAGASPTAWYSNFPNTPKLNTVYPVSLAEKIARVNLNDPDDPDIFVTVNKDQDWYYDFDNPGGVGSRFDFVTIMIHEILHGLGYTAQTGVADTGEGFIRVFSNRRYTAFTDFVFNGGGLKLTDFEDETIELGNELVSNNLYFKASSSIDQYKLYAPSEFSGGSSISHLDEQTYNNTEDDLMTPFAARGNINHHPGLSLEILYDMGWNFTYLAHSDEQTVESDTLQDYIVECTVDSDAGFDSISFVLHYSSDGFVNEDSVVNVTLSDNNLFTSVIPALGSVGRIDYYFELVDNRSQKYIYPFVDENEIIQTYSHFFGPDGTPPLIRHTPITEITENAKTIDIAATATDVFTGIDTMYIMWSINGVAQANIGLELTVDELFGEESYRGQIALPSDLTAGDIIEYRIQAMDRANTPNVATAPIRGGQYRVTVVPSLDPVHTYTNDFDTPTEHFEGDFEVATPAGFSNPALHSPHPYPNPGGNSTLDFISTLRIPIIVDDEYPIIEFEEVVLVEPGEPNVPFGQTEFWDYVIVEASILGQNDWKPLLDGYDSSDNTIWSNAYNSGISGNNSNTPGSSNLFINRTIDITDTGFFTASDTIEIRFRLFSDPFAVGWGWAIDDLKIQELATSTKDFQLDEEILVYPNPTNSNSVTVDMGKIANRRIDLFSLDGRLDWSLNSEDRQVVIPLPSEPGTYLLKVTSNQGIVTRKILKME